ncbi:hypothetical protein ACE193_08685 [Bernardetia sp. OM2101]|uniref:hypothetical protein n=1 Tax=Bernardetia sp. OM2101 TaxID=3344876 RepID=UPI0035CF1998
MKYELRSNKINLNTIHKIGVILIFLITLFFCVESFGFQPSLRSEPSTSLNEFISLAETQKLYDKIFDLEFDYDNSKTQNTKIKTPLHLVVEDFRDMLFILLTEDEKNYKKLEKNEEIRLEELEKFSDKKNNYYKEYKWAKAEIKLHHAIIKLSFDEKWASAWRVRQAYKLLLENDKEFPNFIEQKKTLALLQIILASVPQKYQWALDLIGMDADLKSGVKNLQKSTSQTHFFQKETFLWQALLQTYLVEDLIENGKTSKQIAENLIKNYPSERLVLVVSSLVLMKNESHKTALLAWQNYARNYQNNNLTFNKTEYFSQEYLLAELYFYSEKAKKAKFHYLNFLRNTNSNQSNQNRNFIKDSYYKLFLIEWLNLIDNSNEITNQNIQKNTYFNSVLTKEVSKTAVDKNAKKFIESVKKSNHLPNKELYKARILTDGGNYQKALETINQISNSELQMWEEKEYFETILEYKYRKARIVDKLDKLLDKKGKSIQTNQAIQLYKEVIEYSTLKKQNEIHYFAANSALQIGFIYQNIDKKLAKIYFEKAISFEGHQYEESITQKAKLALKKL